MGPLYIATERFSPIRGEDWTRYIAWSGLAHLREVVSLDSMLCPPVVDQVIRDDWPHIVNEDFMLHCFHDLSYLLRRAGHVRNRNLLCVFRDPDARPVLPPTEAAFAFEGYDLVDVQGGVSALTNCGGFPDAFSNAELSEHGLLRSLERAKEVRKALAERYSGHGHERCHVWAIYRADAS